MKSLCKLASAISVLLAAIVIFGGATVYGDSFIAPEPFEIWSEDGTTVFRWNPGGMIAQAGVYRNGTLVYSVENLPAMGESASNFFFSADLRHFAFRPTTGQVVALGFFEDGVLLRSYRIDELVRDMNVVGYTVTTASWEDWSGRSFDVTNNTLTIVTRDDITYVFDITTGEIIYDTAGDRPFIPPAEDNFGFFINQDEMPLWVQEPHVTPQIFTPDVNRVIEVPASLVQPPLADPTLSGWAAMDVSRAVSRGIVPEHLISSFNQPITRAEFADLVVTTYSNFMGGMIGSDDVPALEQAIAERIPAFTDTDNLNVMIAAYLGLITGVGDDRFEPDATLTREQAAVVLSRLVDIILENPLQNEPPVIFDDAEQISEWAAYAAEKMQTMGIMAGVTESRFAPQTTYTREQSIVTMMRIFDLWHHERLEADSAANQNNEAGAEGRVVIISNGIEYEPFEHFLHGAMYVDGGLLSASGTPLRENISTSLGAIRYTPNLQLVVYGEHGRIVTFQHEHELYHDGIRLIGIFADSFSDKAAIISLPDGYETYLVYVDVHWSSGGNEFTLIRYVFKIVK